MENFDENFEKETEMLEEKSWKDLFFEVEVI